MSTTYLAGAANLILSLAVISAASRLACRARTGKALCAILVCTSALAGMFGGAIIGLALPHSALRAAIISGLVVIASMPVMTHILPIPIPSLLREDAERCREWGILLLMAAPYAVALLLIAVAIS